MAMSEQTPLEFEREKWLAEYELRKREIEIKERDQSRSRWSSPVVLAVLAAAPLAGVRNAAATWLNGVGQRDLEAARAEQARIMEETKAEAARILEVIKTGDADKAAANLKFLVDTGLISNPDRIRNIQAFLAHRLAGVGPALPPGPSPADVGQQQQLMMMMMMMMMQDDEKRKRERPPPPPPPPPKLPSAR
jgi:hypothetical protein